MAQNLFIEGIIHEVKDIERGESSRGPWERRTFVVKMLDREWETFAAFNLWRERCALVDQFKVGDQVVVYFEVASRNYEDRWFTDLRATRITAGPAVQQGYGYPGQGQAGYMAPGAPMYPPQGQQAYGQQMPYQPQGHPYQQPPQGQPPYQPPQQQPYQPPQQPNPGNPQPPSGPEPQDDLPF